MLWVVLSIVLSIQKGEHSRAQHRHGVSEYGMSVALNVLSRIQYDSKTERMLSI